MALTKKQLTAIHEAVQKMDAINESDPEGAHEFSDEILCELLEVLGANDVVNARNRLIERCRWWAYA